jgi:hypothetical protein
LAGKIDSFYEAGKIVVFLKTIKKKNKKKYRPATENRDKKRRPAFADPLKIIVPPPMA